MHKHGPNVLGNFLDHAFLDHLDSLQIILTHLNYPDTFRIVRKLSRSHRHVTRSSGLFLDYLDTFLKLSRHCLDCTETFQIIHTLFRLSGHIFQIIRTLFRLSGNFPVHPDTLHIIWIFCIAKYPEILQPIMNLSQKLSGFAKTFRSALLTR